MSFQKETAENLGDGLHISTRSSTVINYLTSFDISNSSVKEVVEVLTEQTAGKDGKATQITLHSDVPLEESEKEAFQKARSRIFSCILELGYKRKYQSPFTAVPSSRFQGIVKGKR